MNQNSRCYCPLEVSLSCPCCVCRNVARQGASACFWYVCLSHLLHVSHSWHSDGTTLQGSAGEREEKARVCREGEGEDRARERRDHGETETDWGADDKSTERYPCFLFIHPSVRSSLLPLPPCPLRLSNERDCESKLIISLHHTCKTRMDCKVNLRHRFMCGLLQNWRHKLAGRWSWSRRGRGRGRRQRGWIKRSRSPRRPWRSWPGRLKTNRKTRNNWCVHGQRDTVPTELNNCPVGLNVQYE